MAMNDLATVLEAFRWTLHRLPNVVGVARGYKTVRGHVTDREGIMVLVTRKVPAEALERRGVVPTVLEGVPTDVVEVGEIRAMLGRTDRVRPAMPGVSVGHYRVTAGTLGAVVRELATGVRLILSNNHVLANVTDGRDGRAAVGDPVLQPGSYDGGTVASDRIASLWRFIPLYRSRSGAGGIRRLNLTDAALARPLADSDITPEVLEIGRVAGVAEAVLGMSVKKSGRTTGVTQATVTGLRASVTVGYGDGTYGMFRDQILTGGMASGGDSGSLLLDRSNFAVGLLFAGSDRVTVHNRMSNVTRSLGVTFDRSAVEQESGAAEKRWTGEAAEAEKQRMGEGAGTVRGRRRDLGSSWGISSPPRVADVPGVIHVHSTCSDGIEPPERLAEIAGRLGLAFVVLTDHNTLEPLKQAKAGVYGRCRLIVGEEVSPPRNHYLALGITRFVPPADDPGEFIYSVASQGGLGFIAHPYFVGRTFYGSTDVRWTDWTVTGFTGVEVWNLGCDLVEGMTTLGRAVWHALFGGRVVRGPDARALAKWDELAASRRVAGIGGLDAHGVPYPYNAMFGMLRTHVLLETAPAPEQPPSERDVLAALASCRCYLAYDALGDARGFLFWAEETTGERWRCLTGDTLPEAHEFRLCVLSPRRAFLRLIGDGAEVASAYSGRLSVTAAVRRAYRVEAYLPNRTGTRLMPWVFTNHIYAL